MSWTYSGNPTSSAKDEVRFLTADTDVTKPWRNQDEEIAYAISLYSSNPPVIGQNFYAAAICAESILAKLKATPLGSKRVGDLSIATAPSTILFYEQTAYRLRQSASLQAVPTYVGGTSISEKEALDADPDRVQPAFKVDGMSNTSPFNDGNPTGF